MPVDPVCGIELDESLALIHEHKGKKYYFCCHGCKRIFVKKPSKWKKDQIGKLPHIRQKCEPIGIAPLHSGHLGFDTPKNAGGS